MKKLLTLAALLAILLPVASSCTEEVAIEPNAPQFSDKAVAYETVVRIPLTEGRVATGERDILDQEKVRTQNIAVLKPVIAAIWEDIDAGRVANYPVDIYPDRKYEGRDFAATVKQRLLENNSPINTAYLSGGVEVVLAGMSGDGTYSQEATALRFVWTDINEKLPDMNVCLVPGEALASYTVQTESGRQSLMSYLSSRAYDGYNIKVSTDEGTRRARNYDEADKFEIMITQGEAAEIMAH